MPGRRRAKARAFGPWADPDFVPPPPPRSKKHHRRSRHKKRFHHAFRVLLALGLVPTKSRQCDPLGLRLNRMHVMDAECEKIGGGGCLTAESAPELAKAAESPLLVSGTKTTSQIVNKIEDVDKTLLNGGSEHLPSTTTTVLSKEIEDDNNINLETGEEIMDIVDNVKGTKEVEEVVEEEEELEGDDEELVEDTERPIEATVEEEKDDVAEEEEEESVTINREDEEEDEEEEDEPEVTITRKEMVIEQPSRLNNEETKEVVQKIQEVPVTVEEHVENLEKKVIITDINVNNCRQENKPASPAGSSTATSTPQTSLQIKEIKEGLSNVPVSEAEDKPSVALNSKIHQKEIVKRKLISDNREGEGEVSSGSESDTSRKKIKVEPDLETTTNNEIPTTARPPSDHNNSQHIVDDDRERFIQEFITQCSQNVEDMDRAAERLHKEVETLAELARAKELEWNAIIRVRKMREEMLERLLRKRRIATEEYLDRPHLDNSLHKNVNKCQGSNQLMMVPIVSSSPGAAVMSRGPPPVRLPEYGKQQRPILPKPYGNVVDPNSNTREGRNGPIVDVKSIIADYSSGYRSRHPEGVPRRGRRMRGGPIIEPPPNRMSFNPSLISMANMALGTGASIRTVNDTPYNLSQDHSRPSSTDPTRGGPPDGGNNMGYKDVLVQFAKMTNQPGVGHGGKGPPIPLPPPPPYPEVTLHPVSRPASSPPTPPSSSLLHGILTKSSGSMGPAAAAAAAAATRPPANFSPTLARLLTAPDRPTHPVQPPPHFRPQHPPRVSIADILSSSKKTRNEITITPVSGNPTAKPKEDVVLLQDDDEAEVSDRLVIDESGDNEEIPQCQGCRQKPAQFVCAGCGNQWYCSRECQVTAWEEHSDVCSG